MMIKSYAQQTQSRTSLKLNCAEIKEVKNV